MYCCKRKSAAAAENGTVHTRYPNLATNVTVESKLWPFRFPIVWELEKVQG